MIPQGNNLFTKILIANRGEIAVRVIRACHELGIRSVAIYSEIDRGSLHVQLADEAYLVGPPPAAESYLNIKRIISIATQSGSEAVHPGYGFLAENPDFAQAVIDDGLVWIGPPPSVIAAMGAKTRAREIMIEAGIPVVPGSSGGLTESDDPIALAEEIGFPVLIKAVMGGGGKGMRIVNDPEELPNAIESAQRESLAAFASSQVYLEKYLERPRHIEFQIFADNHGNFVHMCERECSIQRRHQKVIEESPSPIMTPELREKMGKSAVAAARACGYRNAGTVEFLMDRDLNYYFLEMNTRLQVEHPVTEMVTSIDLCKLQIRVAAGEKLPISQDDIRQNGHAIETRIYSEDSLSNFLPFSGRVICLRPPDGFGVREDSGVQEGDYIDVYYDPLISKLIVWGENRDEAIRKMRRALGEYRISGIRTTIPFSQLVMENESFQRGDFDTSFIEREFDFESLRDRERQVELFAAIAAAWLRHSEHSSVVAEANNNSRLSTNGSVAWKYSGRREALR